MRNLLTALVLASCAALAACGGGNGDGGGGNGGGDGGTGGVGGSGGTGGTGGTAGAGGTGGAGDENCGNKEVDPGEECDDGNPFSGDGCSSACTIESGKCDEPRDFLFVSRAGRDNVFGHVGSLAGPGSVSTCGVGDGAEMTYIYTAPYDGRLQIQASPTGSTYLSVSTTCGDASTNLVCETGGAAHELEVAKDEVLYFVVDTPATAQAVEYTLAVRLVPIFGLGDNCPPPEADANIHGACAEELICSLVDAQRICVQPNAPVITGADAFRIGDDLQLVVDGRDDDRDASGVVVVFLDAAGAEIPVTGGDTPTSVKIPFDESMAGLRGFLNTTATATGFFIDNPAAGGADIVSVTIYDSRDRRSDDARVLLVTE